MPMEASYLSGNTDSSIEERIVHLKLIADRRHVLLRYMYQMLIQKDNVSSILPQTLDHPGADDFVSKFDLFRNPESGYSSEVSVEQLINSAKSATDLDTRLPPMKSSDDEPVSARGQARPEILQLISAGDSPNTINPFITPTATDDTPLLQLNAIADENPEGRSAMQSPLSAPVVKSASTSSVPPVDVDMADTPQLASTVDRTSVTPSPSCDATAHQDQMQVDSDKPVSASEHTTTSPAVDPMSILSSNGNQQASGSIEDLQDHLPKAINPMFLMKQPKPADLEPHYSFKDVPFLPQPLENLPPPVVEPSPAYDPDYTLPSLKVLGMEPRKSKTIKQRRKSRKPDDRTPIGLTEWGAAIRANPIWRKVTRATKCLTTRDWGVAFTEHKLIRTLDRVEYCKDYGRWSFRQPKKQRHPASAKSHHDYLLDEMKWMRTDFREERKWKLAVCYHLGSAVLKWHAAGDLETRIAKGICVLWKRFNPADEAPGSEAMDVDMPMRGTTRESSSGGELANGYNSDEDEDDDQEKEQSNDHQPSELPDDDRTAREAAAMDVEHSTLVTFKAEDTDDVSMLHLAEVPSANDSSSDIKVVGLKEGSIDPQFSAVAQSQETPPSSKSRKSNIYEPLREQVAYLPDDKVFLDFQDLNMSLDEQLDATNVLAAPDLHAVFPDLTPFNLFEPPSASAVSNDGKKKDKRYDAHKRVDELTPGRIFTTGRFMYSKPTLLGPLQPSKRWQNDHWITVEDSPVTSDWPNATGKLHDDNYCSLWQSRGRTEPSFSVLIDRYGLKDAKDDSASTKYSWSDKDDALLLHLCDIYSCHIPLITECFNASRKSIASDYRSERDVFDRYRILKQHEENQRRERTQSPAANQMTTRGVKRAAAASPPGNGGSDAKKRRRHTALQEAIRKCAKRRQEASAKMTQRKPSTVHESHGQYNKAARLTPQELSRLKIEADLRSQNNREMMQQRQQDLLARQAAMREANGTRVVPPAQPPAAQQVAAGAGRGAVNGQPQQMRGSIANISQQQRAPVANIPAGARVSPQQMLQAQQAQAQARAAQMQQNVYQIAQAQAAQAQAQAHAQAQNGVVQHGSHLSPHYVSTSRDATSSPATHLSPPQQSATPVNTSTSPRPPSAQAQMQLSPPQQTNVIQAAQVANSSAPHGTYYIPNVNVYQPTDAIQSAIRMQLMQQHPMALQGQVQQVPQLQQQVQQVQQAQQVQHHPQMQAQSQVQQQQ
ncbi:hypothetical protein FISHEDRAFT_78465 [Fistulina hepatica ATCC 64428]|nr:hypothetical protein FISHEDRAFT_78465 [Fistulina hepatica ATCC 64428]